MGLYLSEIIKEEIRGKGTITEATNGIEAIGTLDTNGAWQEKKSMCTLHYPSLSRT
jgi:hypothetical protein